MPVTLSIRDETTSGRLLNEWSLQCLTERLTVRELIRSRVYQEVQDFNLKQPEIFRGLVQPTDAEQTLNGFKLRKTRALDWKLQFDRAVAAFEANQILILVDDRQAISLDEEVQITPGTKVSFLRLTFLVGG
jgi:hypothetical protein